MVRIVVIEEKTTNWREAIGEIAVARRQHAENVLRCATTEYDKATRASQNAEDRAKELAQRHGKKSGHKSLQTARNVQQRAQRHVHVMRTAYEVACAAVETVEMDHARLTTAVEQFLEDGSVQTVCPAINLQIGLVTGNLNIYFRLDDKPPFTDKDDHGHYVIDPDAQADDGSLGALYFGRPHGVRGGDYFRTPKPIVPRG